jgi:hypothetical protein
MEAYVKAVCNQACCQIASFGIDVNKIDFCVLHEDVPTPAQFQLKASSPLQRTAQGNISFQVDEPTHSVLRYQQDSLPRYLLLMDLPTSAPDWIEEHSDRVHIKHKIYWYSVMGDASLSGASKLLSVPPTQIFDVAFLLSIFAALDAGLKAPGQP